MCLHLYDKGRYSWKKTNKTPLLMFLLMTICMASFPNKEFFEVFVLKDESDIWEVLRSE